MTKTALLIVDVQPDFCEGGALAVTGGNAVARGIRDRLTFYGSRYDLVVTSQDWHRADSTNCGHIALPPEVPNYVDTWPVHCIADTPGSRLHPAIREGLRTVPRWVGVRKGQDVPAYSAFEGSVSDLSVHLPDWRGANLASVLRAWGVTDLDVAGIATDHCVKASVLDAVKVVPTVNVLTSLCAGVDEEASRMAFGLMDAVGARLCVPL